MRFGVGEDEEGAVELLVDGEEREGRVAPGKVYAIGSVQSVSADRELEP